MPHRNGAAYILKKAGKKVQTYIPSYYNEFSCIKSRCKHNCCIGWEIDIDNDTYNKYLNTSGNFAKLLKQNIAGNETPHFVLASGGRCPFLNKENLCDIILTLGEDALCEICSLHPRFVNYFESRVEIGLGLCCEEAARIILTNTKKVNIIKMNDGAHIENIEEKAFFDLRNRILEIILDRKININERIIYILDILGVNQKEYKRKEIYNIYYPLERLDALWDEELNKLLSKQEYSLPTDWDIIAEQLLVYFVYRHLSGGIDDGHLQERLKFAVVSYNCIKEICKSYENISIKKIIEIARMYSAEIEYSDENLQYILNII